MPRTTTKYLIGRSAHVDIVFEDPTVSRVHAELVIDQNRTWYLTDLNSTGGTFRWADEDWVALTQDYIGPKDRLKFGAFECSVDDLLERIRRKLRVVSKGSSGKPGTSLASGSHKRDDRPKGPVRRDPLTGEVVPVED